MCPVYGSGVLMVLFVLYAINRLFNLNTNIGTAHTFMLFIIGIIILIIVYLTFLSDVVITILTVLKLNKELEKMEELQKSISKLSEDMSELIGNSTLKAVDKIEEEHREVEEKKEVLLEAIQDKKFEYESKRAELEGRFDHIRKEIMYRRLFGTRRLIIAFPNIKHHRFQNQIEQLFK